MRVALYPERTVAAPAPLDAFVADLVAPAARLLDGPRRLGARSAAALTGRHANAVRELRTDALRAEAAMLRAALAARGDVRAARCRALAVVGEVAARTLGVSPYAMQRRAALALLDGRLVEMATGEGKSFTAALAAAVAALAGRRVHVVTVNDVLAARDANAFATLFVALGLRASAVVHATDEGARRAAYRGDIVYVANKEVAFDALRDRLRMGGAPDELRLKLARLAGTDRAGGEPVLAGLDVAIVDEADSVLVDEVRTPLILAESTDRAAEARWAAAAHAFADALAEGPDYTIDHAERRVSLTDRGRETLEALAGQHGPAWQNRIRREEAVRSAIAARALFRRGEHYVVEEGAVVIVDEYTGRLMPERSWSGGLHQLVEHKEGVPVTAQKRTLASMTYQHFFRRYRTLAGMTGTAREVRGELAAVFGLATVTVPPRLPSRMRRLAPRIFPDQAAKWGAVAERVRELQSAGRPVLVGTRSVAASEAASAALGRAGVPHSVLNALNDAEEAAVIARAGERGVVTVATNMAGRGVHIGLGPGVAAAGGLHVILTERHDSGRIDRQLEGRTARQGEPGSTEAFLALDDPLVRLVRRPVLSALARAPGPTGRVAQAALFRAAQRRQERLNRAARRALLARDRTLTDLFAYGGRRD